MQRVATVSLLVSNLGMKKKLSADSVDQTGNLTCLNPLCEWGSDPLFHLLTIVASITWILVMPRRGVGRSGA
jgi:hypothetical protein